MSILTNKPNAATRFYLASHIHQAITTGEERYLRVAGVQVHSLAWKEATSEIERLELILEALGVQP